MMNEEKLLILYNLYINPPFLNYSKLTLYSKQSLNMNINPQKLRIILLEKFPNISNEKVKNRKEYRNRLKENKLKREKKKEFSETHKKVIKLASEGKLQDEIGGILNISQAYVSRIIKRSGLEIAEIKKTRTINKLGDLSLNDMTDLFYELGSKVAVLKWCRSLEINISSKDLIYIYNELLNLKKTCQICGEEMETYRRGYCSKKCAKEGRRDSIRTQQFNRRLKGGGKTTQSVSREAKIKEVDGICYLCKEKLDVSIKDKYHPLYIVIDHVEALIHSNDTSEDNLRAVCRCCNTLKLDKPADYFQEEEYKRNRWIKAEGYVPKTNNFEVIDTEQFRADCEAGMTINELCSKYNKSNIIIWKLKRNLGLNKKQKPHVKLNPEVTLLQVIKMTNEGKNIKEIANILGSAEVTVSLYRRKAFDSGLLERNQKEKTQFDSDFLFKNVTKLTQEGKKITEIIEILGVSQSTISRYRKEAYQKGFLKNGEWI
ncbi:hypothetical protein [Viridibacillus arvi]|uniref:hypothetical protein n=1 Tax=Viridibacillus arvi TaxID=263475 RepID=UPI003D01F1AE